MLYLANPVQFDNTGKGPGGLVTPALKPFTDVKQHCDRTTSEEVQDVDSSV